MLSNSYTQREYVESTGPEIISAEGVVLKNLIPNGSFESVDSWDFWLTEPLDSTQSKDGLKSFKIGGDSLAINHEPLKPVVGHKYYGREYIKTNGAMEAADCRFEMLGMLNGAEHTFVFGWNRGNYPDWHITSDIVAVDRAGSEDYHVRTFTVGGTTQGWIDGVMLLDLTESFGAGKEPTKEWLDDNVPFFSTTFLVPYEAEKPLNLRATSELVGIVRLEWDASNYADGYRVYRDGKLISEQNKTTFEDKSVNVGMNYTYTVSAYNMRGESDATMLLVHTSELKLITNRNDADISRVSAIRAKGSLMTADELQEWLNGMKGSYNASDLNRVEAAVQYIANRFSVAGIKVDVITRTDWMITDFPTPKEMKRYLDNVKYLRGILTLASDAPQVPDNMDKLTYEEANNIERILIAIDELLTNISLAWYYSNEIYAGEVT